MHVISLKVSTVCENEKCSHEGAVKLTRTIKDVPQADEKDVTSNVKEITNAALLALVNQQLKNDRLAKERPKMRAAHLAQEGVAVETKNGLAESEI